MTIKWYTYHTNYQDLWNDDPKWLKQLLDLHRLHSEPHLNAPYHTLSSTHVLMDVLGHTLLWLSAVLQLYPSKCPCPSGLAGFCCPSHFSLAVPTFSCSLQLHCIAWRAILESSILNRWPSHPRLLSLLMHYISF